MNHKKSFPTTRRLLEIVHLDPMATEIISASVLMVWSLTLLIGPKTFEVLSMYDFMDKIMPEPGWAILMGVTGIAQGLALLANHRGMRRTMAMLALGLWSFVAALLTIAGPPNTEIGVYVVLATACAWAYWQIPFHQ